MQADDPNSQTGGDAAGVALVTGGGRRIGRALSLALAGGGWTVAVHYNGSAADAQRVADEIAASGGRASAFGGELTEEETPDRLMDAVGDRLGPVSCLVNNAARFDYDEALTMTVEGWDRHMQVNLRAPVFLARAMAKRLPEDQTGNIINIIDERVWKQVPTHFSYGVSKSALWSATRMLAQSFAPRIRVNAVGPGPTLQGVHQSPEDFARENSSMLLGHGTNPEEIARAAQFILASPAMTGQMIALDGGQHLLWQTPDMDGVDDNA